MKLPKKIYLQGNKDFAEFKGFGDVTWCADKISEDDTLYIQVDEVLNALPTKDEIDNEINFLPSDVKIHIGVWTQWMRNKIKERIGDEK